VSDWRRPVRVKYAGRGAHSARGRNLGHFRLEGEHAAEDLARILRGLVCTGCWQSYPEELGPRSARSILNAIERWPRPRDQVLELLMRGQCGVCGTEVSQEMARFMFQGEEHTREVAPGVTATGEAGGELVTDGGVVLPAGVG
jgi:Na+-translocating ferredoxin:NAD+ oxidoreductase RNF subunit RnfB